MKAPDIKTKLFLDSGDPAESRQAKELLGRLDGQTTNPSLRPTSSTRRPCRRLPRSPMAPSRSRFTRMRRVQPTTSTGRQW